MNREVGGRSVHFLRTNDSPGLAGCNKQLAQTDGEFFITHSVPHFDQDGQNSGECYPLGGAWFFGHQSQLTGD